MTRLFVILLVVWLLLLPPLFTDGACTAEFEEASAKLERSRRAIFSSTAAARFLQEQSVPFALITLDDCRRVKPRFLEHCGSGNLVYAQVPVKNTICRLYRDDNTRGQLHYNERDRLERIVSDMAPYKSLALPWGGYLHWAR